MNFVIRLETLCSREHRPEKDMLYHLVGSERCVLKCDLKHSERSCNFCKANRGAKHKKLYSFHGHSCMFTFFWQTCRNFICDAPSVLPDVESFQLCAMQGRFFSTAVDSSVFAPACSGVFFRTVPSICLFQMLDKFQRNKQKLNIIAEIILT